MPLCESDLPLSQNNRCGLAVHNNMAICYPTTIRNIVAVYNKVAAKEAGIMG